jgi:two-component system KDP operon response regulator KdpE
MIKVLVVDDEPQILRALRINLRARGYDVEVAACGATSSGCWVAAALDAGADDYVTKPFGVDELLARIRAVTRRTAGQAAPGATVTIGRWQIQIADRMVCSTEGTEQVRLTPTEWKL